MKARTDFEFADLIGQCVVRVDGDGVIAEIHRLLIAVAPRGCGNIQDKALREDAVPDVYRRPLQPGADGCIGEPARRRGRTIGEVDAQIHKGLKNFVCQPTAEETLLSNIDDVSGGAERNEMIGTRYGITLCILHLISIVVVRKFLEEPSGNGETIFKVSETQVNRRELNLREAKCR